MNNRGPIMNFIMFLFSIALLGAILYSFIFGDIEAKRLIFYILTLYVLEPYYIDLCRIY